MTFVLGWPKIYQFIGMDLEYNFLPFLHIFLTVPDWRNGLIPRPAQVSLPYKTTELSSSFGPTSTILQNLPSEYPIPPYLQIPLRTTRHTSNKIENSHRLEFTATQSVCDSNGAVLQGRPNTSSPNLLLIHT